MTEPRISLFISYSRRDRLFALRVTAALEAANFDVWIDRDDIPYSADWWRAIRAGIDSAAAFVCIMSNASLSSRVCNLEIEYARQNNKRIIPLVRQDADAKWLAGEWFQQDWEETARENWSALRKLNYIFCRRKPDYECQFDETTKEILNPDCDGAVADADAFDGALTKLLETCGRDPTHLEYHARMLVRAREWEAKQDSGLLLRGNDLREAENWLRFNGQQEPVATTLQTAYIEASTTQQKLEAEEDAAQQQRELLLKQRGNRRLRIIVGLLVVGLLATGLLALRLTQVLSVQSALSVSIDQLYDAADTSLASEAYGEAIANFTWVILMNEALRDQGFNDAFLKRGNAYFHEARYEEALTDINRALELQVDEVGSLSTRQQIFIEQGERDLAQNDYDRLEALVGPCQVSLRPGAAATAAHAQPMLDTQEDIPLASGASWRPLRIAPRMSSESTQNTRYWIEIETGDGETGWLADDMLLLEGQCSALGYGVLQRPAPGDTLSPLYAYPSPVPGANLIVRFAQMTPLNYPYRGWSLVAPLGSPIMAGPGGGTVLNAAVCVLCDGGLSFMEAGISLGDPQPLRDPGWNFGYGNMVIVRYRNDTLPDTTRDYLRQQGYGESDIYVRFAHLDTLAVTTGADLEPSQVIGEVGKSGNSSGPRLYMEVRVLFGIEPENISTDDPLLDPALVFENTNTTLLALRELAGQP